MEEIAIQITRSISHAAEILAAVIVGTGILKVLINYISHFHPSCKIITKEEIRVQFGSTVAVSLELLLGADVLATAVAPSWNDIGQLAAIAILRTALNYFLSKELEHMRQSDIRKTASSSGFRTELLNANELTAESESYVR